MIETPTYRPHPLKDRIQRRGLALWQLRELIGGSPSEGKLSRYLNGVDRMPVDLEERLNRLLEDLRG